ncbi:MAG: hypothetical protein F6K35_52055, partial [Okeania sp. SIO2H7]|nr:hypothetical protein [Okeania sp. SIO2H7]
GEGVRLWNQSGERIGQFSGRLGIVDSASFSADGQRLAAVDGERKVIVWNLSGTELFKLYLDNPIMSAGFSSDGERLATAELDGRVRIWSKSGEQLAEFDAYQDQPRHIGFNSDRQHVATVGINGAVKLWNVAGRQVAEFEGTDNVSRVSFSPDGRHVAAATGSGVVWLRRVEGLDELLGRGCKLLEGYRDRYPETINVCLFAD